jgi:hypothetical protein
MGAEIMRKLYRYELDFERTIKFFKDNLDVKNALSSGLLNLVDFKSGIFFTLLTSGSDLERLYEFKSGVILPQNPIIVTETDGKKSRSQEIPTIKEELSDFLYHKISSNPKLSCIFDEVTLSPDDSSLEEFYEKKSVYLYKNEIIYVIREPNKNHEFISDCIWNSFSFWHSVGALTEADCFKTDSNILSLEDIQTICNTATMILVGAYDGEGYVLWERTSQV